MRGNQRTTLWKRIRSRVKGLAAVIMAVALVIGLMPVSEVMADETEKYYFAMGYYNAILGKGNVEATGVSSFAEGSTYPSFKDGITKLGDIGETYDPIKINPESDTTFYYGGTQSGCYRIYLEGTQKAYGNQSSTYGSFPLPAGKYTVQYTSKAKEGSVYVWRIDINEAIESITLSPSTLSFMCGDEAKTLTVSPETAVVTWSSSDESVATVNDSGSVTPVGVGSAVITATLNSDSSVKATCIVTVNTESDPGQTVSENARTLVVKNKSSITKLFSKYGESGYKYKFKVEDKNQRKIASVTRKGKIKVKKAGSVKVSLFRKAKKSAWAKIEEQTVKAEKPEVTQKVTNLKVGDTVEASSFITNQKDLVNKPTSYVSTNTKVATVDSKTGKVTILKKGSTKIKMIYGSEKGAAVYKTKIKVNG